MIYQAPPIPFTHAYGTPMVALYHTTWHIQYLLLHMSSIQAYNTPVGPTTYAPYRQKLLPAGYAGSCTRYHQLAYQVPSHTILSYSNPHPGFAIPIGLMMDRPHKSLP